MIFQRSRKAILTAGSIFVLLPALVLGQTVYSTAGQPSASPGTEGNTFLSFLLEMGGGLEKHEVAITTDNETVEISAGGGIGMGVQAGYLLTHALEVEAEAAYMISVLSHELENGEGGFNRGVFAGNLLYRVPIKENIRVLIGGGAGYYVGGEMDLDFSSASDIGGAHNIYKYDNALGFQARCVLEVFGLGELFSKNMVVGVGIQYSSVRYDLQSMSSNGVDIPLDQLPKDIRAEFGELDGSGIDVVMHIALYL